MFYFYELRSKLGTSKDLNRSSRFKNYESYFFRWVKRPISKLSIVQRHLFRLMKESSKKKARIIFPFESFERKRPINFGNRIRVKVPFTPPSYGEKFISTFITATVWAGVLVTLPLTFFWVFKKEKENEKILVRRLGNGSVIFGPED